MWALAIAAGIPDEVFWRSTEQEIAAVLECRYDEARAATLRAGLIAATIINVNKRRGARMVQPSDFLQERRQPGDFMDVAEAAKFMDGWAKAHNAALQDAPPKPKKRKEKSRGK